eukprot:s1565_g3.t1
MRFTRQDGDLATFSGQLALLRKIFLYNPRHVWMAPECRPWGAWSKFNQMRGITSFNRVQEDRQSALIHLRLCSLICKIQFYKGDHAHLENPAPSCIWEQKEFENICRCTKPAFFDQCSFNLKHPETGDLLKKSTRVQTSSDHVFKALDARFCTRNHQHHQIAGSCVFRGKRIALSQFAAMYPRELARKIAQAVLNAQPDPLNLPATLHVHDTFPASEEIEPPAKRLRFKLPQGIKRSAEPEKFPVLEESGWKTVMEDLRRNLPKSGVQSWDGPNQELVKTVQSLCPDFQVQGIMAGKGREKYMSHPDNLPFRRTVVLSREGHEVFDLGTEDLQGMSRNHQARKAFPSHVMLCIFGRPKSETGESVPMSSRDLKAEGNEPLARVPNAAAPSISEKPCDSVDVPVAPWTTAAATISGPKFLALSSEQQGIIKKLHVNLSHPTAERLSRHLQEQGADTELVQGAKDYLCSSCAERRPPSLNPPGTLKEARDFNQRISLDGFDWKSQTGYQGYVVHIIDEATQFHQGHRTTRDAHNTWKVFTDFWQAWAGNPLEMVMDCGGELISDDFKNYLQQEGIQPILTARPWQRGRVERHGGIIKEMLSRIDQESPIRNEQEFDRALNQCFRAKNSMSCVNGYSPEQAVLGRATRLPASITGDSEESSHLQADNPGPEADRFRQALELRTLARKAFLDSDNSQAIRRAMLRRSRGVPIEWQCGQPCMFWDRRRSPNMLEKGKWCGPAQVVLVESKTVVWITHMNRLLRCARDNLRPVSLRELQSHSTFSQQVDQERLRRMSEQLQTRLHDRSGMFQFSDMSEDPIAPQAIPDEERDTNRPQPEEEPTRRASTATASGVNVPNMFDVPVQTPVPGDDSDSDLAENPPSTQYEASIAPDPAMEPGDNIGENTDVPNILDGDTQGDNGELLFATTTGKVVHNALIVESVENGPNLCGDEDTLWTDKINSKLDHCSFEFEMPMQLVERIRHQPKIHAALLTTAAKKSRAEVQYSTLDAEEKKLFDLAKDKELKCWLETSAVKKILRNRIHPDRIMTSRWILTYKPDPTSPKGHKHKARLVVRGYQDPELDKVSTDSPTLGRDARQLLLQTVCSAGWDIQSFDITTAFLRGRADGRELAMEPVKELRSLLKMSSDEVCLLEGNAYGRVDAPLLFYKEFRRQLESLGFVAHPLDGCLYMLRNKKDPKKLDGILGTHVDDGIGGGNQEFEKALTQLQKVLPFGQREYRKFRFTGLDIEQLPDNSIRISQAEYLQKIDPINVNKTRRSQKESPANAQEIQDLRALCGSLQYAAVHSRPDLAAKASFLQKSIPSATVQTLLDGNKVLIEAKETAHTAVQIRPLCMDEITFASFGDASFASATQLRAQQGLFVVACDNKLSNNQTSEISPIAWNSKQIGRVVRSTLSAEAYAMSSSLDKLTWLRCMWSFIHNPDFRWQTPEQSLQHEPKALLITDCKSLYDLVTKLATPNCQEWRTTVEVMLIKQQTEGHTTCRWISTAIMLADCLTKPMDASFLRTVLHLGRFRIFDEDQTLQNNTNKKMASRWMSGQDECTSKNKNTPV